MEGAAGARVVAPDTNIVMIDLPDGLASSTVVARCAEHGVKVTPWNASRVRAVTHLDVDNGRGFGARGEVLATAWAVELACRRGYL